MSKLDCYAVLGLSPNAEGVVIRAAYLALMRSYHPDRNPSAEAAARARAVTEAYETIGDPESRAEYDARRWDQFEFLDFADKTEPPRRQWRPAPWLGVVAVSVVPVILAVMALPLPQVGGADTAQPTETFSGKTGATEGAAATGSKSAETRPSAPPASVSRLAEASPPPAPAAPSQTEKARAGPAQTIAQAAPAKTKVVGQPTRATAVAAAPSAAPAKPAPIDEKARVAALESQSTSFYNQSVNLADGAGRLQLQRARDLFVASRNACRSDKCVGDAHANYIRDIALIVQKRAQTTP